MTYIDTGIQGAKRQSWRPDNPRDRLKKLIEDNPKASKEELFDLFSDNVLKKGNQALLLTILEYWFANNLHSLLGANPKFKKKFSAPSSTGKFKDQIKAKIKLAAGMILMDMIMPNKKKLRDCTGAEVQVFGGWLTAVASHMSPSATVKTSFTEEELRSIFLDNA